MSIDDDDDLPVLTQVLRIGDGRLSGADPDTAQPRDFPASSSARGRLSSGQDDGDPSWPRALVIGSDPVRADAGPADGPLDVWRDASSIRRPSSAPTDEVHAGADDAVGAPAATAAAPRSLAAGGEDAFLRSAPLEAEFVDRIDEPPIVKRPRTDSGAESAGEGNGITASTAPWFGIGRDIPLAFGERPATAMRDHDATFALRVRDSVLRELSARIDTELDARIAQTLHAALESALAGLQGNLRVELAEALRDVVGHAVDDAVRRLRDAPGDGAA